MLTCLPRNTSWVDCATLPEDYRWEAPKYKLSLIIMYAIYYAGELISSESCNTVRSDLNFLSAPCISALETVLDVLVESPVGKSKGEAVGGAFLSS